MQAARRIVAAQLHAEGQQASWLWFMCKLLACRYRR